MSSPGHDVGGPRACDAYDYGDAAAEEPYQVRRRDPL